MGKDIDQIFDKIQMALDSLDDSYDNEAMRHDLIIRPFLSNPILLGWHPPELLSQLTTDIPIEIKESYVWKGATPKKRRPDMIIVPYGTSRTVAVIEEKAKQKSLENLSRYLGQVKEYQFMHNAVWGLITDGEKFVLQKNNETYLQFDSLSEVKRGFNDLKECIGRDALMKRLFEHGTTDMIIVRPSPTIIVIMTPHSLPAVVNMSDYLNTPSIENCDLIKSLCKSLKNEVKNIIVQSETILQIEPIIKDLFVDIPADIGSALIGNIQLLLMDERDGVPKAIIMKHEKGLNFAVKRWAKTFPVLNSFLNDIKNGVTITAPQIIDICNQIDFKTGAAISRIKHEIKNFEGKTIRFSPNTK